MAKKIQNDIEEEKKVSKSRKASEASAKDELVPATKSKKSTSKAEKEKSTTKQEDKKSVSKSSSKVVAKTDKAATDVATKEAKIDVIAAEKTTNEEIVKEEAKNTQEAIKTSVKKVEKPKSATIKNSEKPAVRYSDEDLAEFTDVINEARAEAIDELRMLKDRLDDLTSFDSGEESMIYSMHMAEQGSEAQEKEKTYAQIQRIGEHIKKLDDAMERIKDKTYGICRVCGCLIAKERLLAVPITTLSASFKIHSKCPEDGIDRIEPVRF